MDLAKFDLKEAADKGMNVTLAHPVTMETLLDEDGKNVSIKVLGKDSKKWTNTAKSLDAKNANKHRNKKVPTAELEKSILEIIAACTKIGAG